MKMSNPSMSSTQAQQPVVKKQYTKIIGLIAMLLVLLVASTTIGAKPAHAASPYASFTVNIGTNDPGVVITYDFGGTGISTACITGGTQDVGVADPNSTLTVIYFNNSSCTGASHQISFQLGGAGSSQTYDV
jgi:hypothetical protein